MVYVTSAILTLGLLVLVHELGHYLMARLLGIAVDTFSIGFGKPLWKKVSHGTEFRIGWIPLGGYVAYSEDSEYGDVYSDVSPARKSLVALAGPAANLLFAPVVFALVYLIGVEAPNLTISQVKAGSPAMVAGFEANDTISAIDGKPTKEWNQVTEAVSGSVGKPIAVSVIKGDGSTKSLVVLPVRNNGAWQIGIIPATDLVSYGIIDSAALGIAKCVEATEMTAEMIFELITGNVSVENLGGPIMISKIAGEQANAGVVPLLLFIGLLSINFGLMNLLPLPVLDGGQIVIFSLEAVFGRSLSDSGHMLIQRVGIFLLLSIFSYTMYNDISRIIFGS